MKLLLDTHLLIWSAQNHAKLGPKARRLIGDASNALSFSVVSLWEIVIKRGLERADFQIDPVRLHRGLLENGYAQLSITAGHVLAVAGLVPRHKDPFDRLLLAQAAAEGLTLVTTDKAVAAYGGSVIKV